VDGNHGRIDIRSTAVCAIAPVDVGLLSADSGVKVRREWRAKAEQESEARIQIRHFISSSPTDNPAHLDRAVRGHWSVENRNPTSATTPSGKKTAIGTVAHASPKTSR
jgi:hypothetical protein